MQSGAVPDPGINKVVAHPANAVAQTPQRQLSEVTCPATFSRSQGEALSVETISQQVNQYYNEWPRLDKFQHSTKKVLKAGPNMCWHMFPAGAMLRRRSYVPIRYCGCGLQKCNNNFAP